MGTDVNALVQQVRARAEPNTGYNVIQGNENQVVQRDDNTVIQEDNNFIINTLNFILGKQEPNTVKPSVNRAKVLRALIRFGVPTAFVIASPLFFLWKLSTPVNIPKAQTDKSSEITTATPLKEPISSTKETSSPQAAEAPKVGDDGTKTLNVYTKAFNQNGGISELGHPINKVSFWSDGYIQNFAGGSEDEGAIIMSNSSDEAYWVGASFWRRFKSTNTTNGILVYPTSNRYPTNGGWRQNFKGGAIFKSSKGTFPVFGGIGAHYLNTEDGEKGRLGFPIDEDSGIGGGIKVQHFENGCIRYDEHGSPTRTIRKPEKCP